MRRIAVVALASSLFCAGCCCWLCNAPAESHARSSTGTPLPAPMGVDEAESKAVRLVRQARDRNDYAAAAAAYERFVVDWSNQTGPSAQAKVAAATRGAESLRALERAWQTAQIGGASDVRACVKLMRDPGAAAADLSSAEEREGALRLLRAKDPQVQAWFSANFPGRLEPQLGAETLAYEPSSVAIGLAKATQERGIGLTSGAIRGARFRYLVEIVDHGELMAAKMHSFAISVSGELVSAGGAVVGKIAVLRRSPGLGAETALQYVIDPLCRSVAAELQTLVQDAQLAGGDKLG